MSMLPFKKKPRLVLGTFGPPFLGGSFALGPSEIDSHKHVMGVMGQGKSKFLASLFVQLINQGIPAGLVDPHSDLAADTLQILLDGGFFERSDAWRRLLYIDFGCRDRFVPFNVLNQPYDSHTVARNMAEVCKPAWPALADGAAPNFENILLASTLVLIDNQLPLTAMPKLLTDKPFREGLLRQVTDPYALNFFHDRFDQWGRDMPTMLESTLRRIFLLTFSPTLRYSLGQTENLLNFRRFMDEGISVIFNLGGLDEDTQRFLGCLLTVGYETAALSRVDVPTSQRGHYELLLDEFSMFSAQSEESLARVLSLCRKYGLFLTMAHQTWSQVSQRLAGALQNCVEIAFKLGRSDATMAAALFGKFDPLAVKHEVADPYQVDRTHPIYFNMQETFESWAQSLESLKPRQAYVKVGDRTAKITTLTIAPAKRTRAELHKLMERYAQELLTPTELLTSTAAVQVEQTGPVIVSRMVRLGND